MAYPEVPGSQRQESGEELRTPWSRGLPRCLGSIKLPSWLYPAPGPSGLESPERGPLAILTPVTPSCPGAPAIFILWLGRVQEFSQQSCWHLGRRDARWNRRPLSGVVGGMRQTPVATTGLEEQVLETTCLEGPLNAWGRWVWTPVEAQTQLPTGAVWRRLPGWARVGVTSGKQIATLTLAECLYTATGRPTQRKRKPQGEQGGWVTRCEFCV